MKEFRRFVDIYHKDKIVVQKLGSMLANMRKKRDVNWLNSIEQTKRYEIMFFVTMILLEWIASFAPFSSERYGKSSNSWYNLSKEHNLIVTCKLSYIFELLFEN